MDARLQGEIATIRASLPTTCSADRLRIIAEIQERAQAQGNTTRALAASQVMQEEQR